MNTPATVDRLMAHVMRSSGCWIWTGAVNNKGYAQVGDAGKTRSAHRVSYELHVGPIADGMTIDHRCHNDDPQCPGGSCIHRRCVRPDHLEAVTIGENVKRRYRDACSKGHEYTPENTTYRKDTGRRVCATCRKVRSAARAKGYGKPGRPSRSAVAAREAARLSEAS